MATALQIGDSVWNKSGSLRGEVIGVQTVAGWMSYKVRWENGTSGWYSRSALDV
jgi:hypothetical protein